MAPASIAQLNDLTVKAGKEELLRANHLDSLNALFAVSHGDSLHKPGLDSWRERIRLAFEHEGVKHTLYLKRFRSPPGRTRRDVRRSGSGAVSLAGVEWTWMCRLSADGIPCVKPIALGEDLDGGRERRSAILTHAVPGRSLEGCVREWSREGPNAVRNLIEPVADLVARLHGCGYIHRDLYLSHIFYDPALVGEPFHLIDLQRVIRPRFRQRRWIIKDLAALNFSTPTAILSRSDRIRWLKRYLGLPKLDGSAKCLAYRVIGKTASIARHETRRKARLRQAETYAQ